jgi:hypothetical protein
MVVSGAKTMKENTLFTQTLNPYLFVTAIPWLRFMMKASPMHTFMYS